MDGCSQRWFDDAEGRIPGVRGYPRGLRSAKDIPTMAGGSSVDLSISSRKSVLTTCGGRKGGCTAGGLRRVGATRSLVAAVSAGPRP